eukprot:scaffold271468_cov32-Tisochrysis_lutea.AAC.2
MSESTLNTSWFPCGIELGWRESGVRARPLRSYRLWPWRPRAGLCIAVCAWAVRARSVVHCTLGRGWIARPRASRVDKADRRHADGVQEDEHVYHSLHQRRPHVWMIRRKLRIGASGNSMAAAWPVSGPVEAERRT